MLYNLNFHKKFKIIISASLFFLLLSILLSSFSCGTKEHGSLKGICTGREDKLIANANVVLSGKALETARTAITDTNGLYRFTNLPAGNNYTITFNKKGLNQVARSWVVIKPGKETILDISFGRWGKSRENNATVLTEEQKRKIKELEAIGYLAGYKQAAEKKNITVYNKKLAYDGINLFTSGHKPAAYLIDMEGKILHKWSYTRYINWPSGGMDTHNDYWRRVSLYPNGDLLAIYEGLGIIKLDKNSNLLWINQNAAHHDLDVAENGMIYVLTREAKMNVKIHILEPVLEDYISILTNQGKTIKKISLYKAYRNSSFKDVLKKMTPHGDIFHTNTLEIFDGKHADRSPLFTKGNALISSREMNTIAIVDLNKETVIWSMAGNWSKQHQPTLLENGNMMLFDNTHKRGVSRIIEFDPLTKEKHWIYKGKPLSSFYSSSCGSNQRLPNGNTLITESDNGRAFEVTHNGQIVWEFYNPHRAGNNNELVATLFEVIRLEPDDIKEMGL